MIDDDESDHSRDPDVEKVTHRKMVVLAKILDDHGDELKVKEKDQDLLEEFTEGRLMPKSHLCKVNQLFTEQKNENDSKKNERCVQNLLEQQRNGELLECRFQMFQGEFPLDKKTKYNVLY